MSEEKVARNKELVQLRESDPIKWSFNEIARYFTKKYKIPMSPQNACLIYHSYREKYGKK